MRLSVERIRWGLLAGALMLLAVMVVLLGYGRYRAVKAWKQIVARSGATITHETNGITWSQAVRGKTIFTLHAARAVPHGNGQYTLENGMLLLYGANGQPADRIYGAKFEYDEKQGVARALGEVDMDLVPPVGLMGKTTGATAADAKPQAIRVRTSGLTYVKKLGVAATDQEVEIEYGGLRGWSKGAEFDSGESVVHLLADVRAEGELRGRPATLTAAKADLDQEADVIRLAGPVVVSQGREARAAAAVLHLRKDGSLERVEASGGVTLKEGTRTVTAASLEAAMNGESQMQRAELRGGTGFVNLLDTSTARPMHGQAKTATIACDSAGQPASVVMQGGVSLVMEDRRPGAGAPGLARQMGAERMTLTLVHARRGTKVSAVQAEGGAWARGEAVVRAADGKPGGVKVTTVAADDLRVAMTQDATGKEQPDRLSGNGHTKIERRMPDGTVETSTGDRLDAQFAQAARGMEIASAVQSGHVAMRSVPGKPGELPSDSVAEQASLDGANQVLTLSGHPRITRGDTSMTAATVRVIQQSGDAVASGSVEATFVSADAKNGAPVTHAMAADAVLHKAAETMELHGTDAAPARMWQGASQVEAANLLLDRAKDAMQAWPAGPQGVVRTVFADQGPGSRAQGPEGQEARGSRTQGPGERVVRVTSARMEYSGAAHEAVFTGGVLAEAVDGTVRAQRGVAFLSEGQRARGPEGHGAGRPGSAANGQPDPVAAQVEKIVLTSGVKLEQPGRTATGEQLLYTAATGEFVLTGTPGHPPHVVDAQQGSITGATLLFRSPDSTIVVAGEPASRRVHTETTMKK
jgi:lipopolysaccharide export system protein LptA